MRPGSAPRTGIPWLLLLCRCPSSHDSPTSSSSSVADFTMSSLAASRADNFYYGPDFDGKKHGSLNKYRGQHPLRERARKLDQGILIIRFEMPFHIFCDGCNSVIAKGVRFNAEKKQIGTYYSSKIWSFSMRCATCSHPIEIQTDPKNTDYIVAKGAESWGCEGERWMDGWMWIGRCACYH